MNVRDELTEVYRIAAAGDPAAFQWLLAWHDWAHQIDDHVDDGDHPAREVVRLSQMGIVLMSCDWFARHAVVLGPVLAVVAEQYRESVRLEQIGVRSSLIDVLRLAGNQVVLVVAYLCGGLQTMEAVTARLWPIVEQCQLGGPRDAGLSEMTKHG